MGPKIVSTAASITGLWALGFGGGPPGRGRGVGEERADRGLDVEIARAGGAEGKGGGSAVGDSGSADAGAGTGDDSDTADVVSDGGLADDGEVIDMTDGDEDDPREIHWRWSE